MHARAATPPGSRIARAKARTSCSWCCRGFDHGLLVRDRQRPMRPFLLWLFSAIVAGVVGVQAVKFLVTSAPIRRRNYRGLELPATAGIGVIVGVLAGLALTAVLHMLFGSSRMLSEASRAGLLFATAGGVFGFIGLWDDLAGTAGERGWRAHARAAVRGRATAGAIKLFGGAAAALVVASVLEERFGVGVGDAL